VTDNSSIDQHFVKNPSELFTRSPDPLRVDLDSSVIVEAHLQCAAQEMPLSDADEKYFGSKTRVICENKLVRDAEGW
jgi:DEAD/DEAH box helicase domain-containing protein